MDSIVVENHDCTEMAIEVTQVVSVPRRLKAHVDYVLHYDPLKQTGLIFTIHRKKRFKWRNRGIYRYNPRRLS